MFTQADLDALDAAIKSKVHSVRFQDQMTTYRTVEEMMEARAFIFSQLNPATSALAPKRQVRAFSDKGIR